jgi:hypothetical protein
MGRENEEERRGEKGESWVCGGGERGERRDERDWRMETGFLLLGPSFYPVCLSCRLYAVIEFHTKTNLQIVYGHWAMSVPFDIYFVNITHD